MELNEGLVKAILKYVAKCDETGGKKFLAVPEFPQHTSDEIDYHLDLCHEAGFIRGQETSGTFYPSALTWTGHKELERLRAQGT